MRLVFQLLVFMLLLTLPAQAQWQWERGMPVDAKIFGHWVPARVVERTGLGYLVLQEGARGEGERASEVRPRGGYQPEQAVEVERHRAWQQAVVVSSDDNFVTVTITAGDDAGDERRVLYRSIRPRHDGPNPGARDHAGGGFRRGDAVQVQSGEGWESATVVSIAPNGVLLVRYTDPERQPHERRVQPRIVRADPNPPSQPLETPTQPQGQTQNQPQPTRQTTTSTTPQTPPQPVAQDWVINQTDENWIIPSGNIQGFPSIPTTPTQDFNTQQPLHAGAAFPRSRVHRVWPLNQQSRLFLVEHRVGFRPNEQIVLEISQLGASRSRIVNLDGIGNQVVSVSPQADHALVLDAQQNNGFGRLILASIGNPGHAIPLATAAIRPDLLRGIQSHCHLLDDKHVLLTQGGFVTLVDLPAQEVRWSLAVGNSRWTYNPEHNLVLGRWGEQLIALNPLDQTVVARLPSRANGKMTISPSRSRIAVLDSDLIVLDAATGQVISQTPRTQEGDYDGAWLTDRYWLTEDGRVVDTDHAGTIWSLNLDHRPRHTIFHRMCWSPQDGGSNFLIVSPLATAQQIADWGELDADAVWGLRPGSPIQIDMRFQHEPTRERLTAAIQQAGYVLADNAPFRLVARTQNLDVIEQYMERFGERRLDPLNPPAPNVRYHPRRYVVELIDEQTTLWSVSNTQRLDHMIPAQENETPQQAVDREMQPDYDRYVPRALNLPSAIPFANLMRGYGESPAP